MEGIHVPLTIPFARDGAVAWAKLAANVRRYSLAPVSGLVALAPGFEAGALSDDECCEVLRIVRSAASDEKVLVAGVARESVHAALGLIDRAKTEGFDAVLLVAPLLRPAEQSMFLRSVADAASLPIMLWGEGLATELLHELAHHANVLGMYQPELAPYRLHAVTAVTSDVKREVMVTTVFAPATRRMQHSAGDDLLPVASLGGGTATVSITAKPVRKLRTRTIGFQVLDAGGGAGLLQALEAGAAGAMPSIAACCPQAVFEVYAAFKDGDAALAAEKALRVMRADKLLRELGVAGSKYGCDVNGYAGGPPRLPRVALTGDDRARVEDALRDTPS